MPAQTLAQAKIDKKYTVRDITLCDAMKRRLTELGLTVGAEVKCILISAHGDMMCFIVRGACIAIRKSDLERIYV